MDPRGGTKMSDSFQVFTVLCQPSNWEMLKSHTAGTRAEWERLWDSGGSGPELTMDQRVDWEAREAEEKESGTDLSWRLQVFSRTKQPWVMCIRERSRGPWPAREDTAG